MRIESAQLGVRSFVPPEAAMRLRLPLGPRLPIDAPVMARLRIPLAPSLRGLAALGVSYDQAYNILAQDVLAYVNNGTPVSAAQFKQAVGSDVMGICDQLKYFNNVNGGDQACPPDMAQQIAAAADSYQKWLQGQPYVPPPSFSSSNYASYGFSNPPGYQTNPYTGASEPIPNYQQQQPVYQTQTQTPPAGKALTVAIANTTRGGSTFRVGDHYHVTVTGPASSQVAVNGVQNGKNLGTTPVGATDSSGTFTLDGVMDQSTVGSWQEVWTVGGQHAGDLSFSVADVATTQPGAGTQTSGGGTQTSGGGSTSTSTSTTDTSKPTDTTKPSTSMDLSFLTKTAFQLGSVAVPMWALVAVVGVGLYMMTQQKGR